MLVNVLGGALIFLTSVFVGEEARSYERIKLKESEAFLNLVRHIRNEIACYKTPLPKIISSYSNKELLECGFLENFDISWNDAVMACSDRLHIDDDVKRILIKFGEELGGSYKDEQISCCDYYADVLSKNVAHMKEELPSKLKIYRSLSAILGILAVIILI